MQTVKFPNDKLLRRIVDRRDKHLDKIADELYETYCKTDIPEISISLKSISEEENIILQSALDQRHEEYLTTMKIILQDAAELCTSYSKKVEQLQDEASHRNLT